MYILYLGTCFGLYSANARRLLVQRIAPPCDVFFYAHTTYSYRLLLPRRHPPQRYPMYVQSTCRCGVLVAVTIRT